MKKLKSLVSLAICGAMLFATACGGDTSSGTSSSAGGGNNTNNLGTSGSGRYIETAVTPPLGEEDSYGLKLFEKPDGSLLMLNEDFTRQWASTDGGQSWTESEGPNKGDLDIAWINNSAMAADGSIIAAVTTNQDRENMQYSANRLYRFTEDGAEPIQLDGYDETNSYINTMEVLDGGRLFLSHMPGYNNMAMVDNEGEPTGEEPGEEEPGEEGGQEPVASPEGEPAGEEPGTDAPEGATVDGGEPETDEPEGDAGGVNVYDPDDYRETHGIYDLATGEKLYDIGGIEYFMASASDGANLYLLDYEGFVQAYDASGDFKAPREAGSFDMSLGSSFGAAIYADSEGSLYYADAGSIQKLDIASGETQSVLDAGGYSLSDPNVSITGLLARQDGSLLVTATEGTEGILYRYAWDPDAQLDPDKILRVWSLYDSTTLRAAISQFRKQNPDGMVQLDIALGDEGGMTAEDAIRNLNTEILNGSGPDLIVLDGAPVGSYINQGVLADLSSLVDTSGMYANLKDAFVNDDGAVYYLPTRFSVPMLAGKNTDLTNDLGALVQKILANPNLPADMENAFTPLPEEEQNLFGFDNLDEWFNLLWSTSAPAIVSNNALDSENLRAFLEALKTVSDHYGLGSFPPDDSSIGGAMSFSAGGSAFSTIEGSLLTFLMSRAQMAALDAGDLLVLNYMLEASAEGFTNLPGIAEGVWKPNTMVGINAGSSKIELAADFINLLLSDSVQGQRTADGYPVTKNGIQGQIDDLAKYMEFEEEMTVTEGTLSGVIDGLTTPNLTDSELTQKIYDVAVKFCQDNGGMDLDGAVSQIEQDVKNYLAERQ